MAIIISTSKEYPYTLMGLFGVSKELMDKAKAVGLSITQPLANSFTFKLNDHAYGTVPVKSQVITLVKKGELGTMSKGSYKGQFETILNKVLAAAGDSSVAPQYPAYQPPVAPQSEFPQPPGPKIKKVGLGSASGPTGTGACVCLKDATQLLQPTFGSSSGAVYLVIALGDGLNLSAKVSGSKLSLRAEGESLNSPAYRPALVAMGFDFKSGYASQHFEVDNNVLRRKTLGALVGSLGYDNINSMVDVNKFLEASNV